MVHAPSIKVWDPALRLSHWGLAVAFALAYASQERDYALHLQSGYLLLGLLAFRILWGFVGTYHARFRNFLTGPAEVLRYLRALAANRPRRYIGHNPAGAAMTVCLLLALLAVSVSGIALDAAENRAGPLARFPLFLHADLVAAIHEFTAHACLGLVALHLAGVWRSSRAHRENLVAAMITGRKPGRTE